MSLTTDRPRFMTTSPQAAMTRAQSKSLLRSVRGVEGLFAPQTLGAFLVDGQRGWPKAFDVQLGESVIRVSKSHITLECQGCSERSQEGQDLYKLRLSIHFEILDQGQRHERHVEDLYPMSIMEALHSVLDVDQAAARVRQAIEQTLNQSQTPIETLLSSCLGPMRLYEPLLNALVPPAPEHSVGGWLTEHLKQVLLEAEGVLFRLKHQGKALELQVQQLQVNRGLRCPNEVKLLGKLVAQDEQTGALEGAWRQRFTLLDASLKWDQRKLERDDQEISGVLERWRQSVRQELERALEEGDTPDKLGKHLAEHSLAQPLELLSAPPSSSSDDQD